MKKGTESQVMKVRFRDIVNLFPEYFRHIDKKDILFYRISKKSDKPIDIITNNKEPFDLVLPYKYIIVTYDNFENYDEATQQQKLAHLLLKIPLNYKQNSGLRQETIRIFEEDLYIKEHFDNAKK